MIRAYGRWLRAQGLSVAHLDHFFLQMSAAVRRCQTTINIPPRGSPEDVVDPDEVF